MARFGNLLHRIPAKRLLGQSFYYLVINVLVAFGPLMLIPFLTRVLNPESYGIYGNFLGTMSVVCVLLSLNTDITVRRHGHASNERLKEWVGASLIVLGSMTLLGILAVLVSGYFWPNLTEAMGIPNHYMVILVCCSALLVLQNISGFVATMREKLLIYGILRIGGVALFVMMVFGFFLGLRGVVGDVLLARALSFVCAGGFGMWWLWRMGVVIGLKDFPAACKRIPSSLAYGLPLLPSIFYDPLMTLINRLALTHHQSLAEAGKYTVAYQLAQPLQLLAGSVGLALFPHMVRWFDENTPDTRKRFIVTGLAMLFCMLAAWFCYAVIALPWILPWIGGHAYLSAAPLVAPLALGFVAGGLSAVLANRYFHNGETWWISFCCLVGLGVNLMACLYQPTLYNVAWGLAAGYMTSCLWLFLGLVLEKKKP